MEKFLRKMMQTAGKAVEKIGKIKSPSKIDSPLAKSEASEAPSLSFPPENLVRKWVEALEQREIPTLIPNLAEKNVIQATCSGNRVWESLDQKNAELIIDVDIGHFEGPPPAQKPSQLQRIKGNLTAAPFPSQSMDYFVLLGAGIRREDPSAWMKEVARVLKDGSRLLLSFLHPFVEYQFHQNSALQHRFDHYFMGLKKAEIYVEEIKEYVADESLKSLVGLARNDKNFSQVKDLPLLLVFKGIRLKRR